MKFEYFTKEEICKGLLNKLDEEDEFYELDHKERLKTCKILYIAFNFSFHTLFPLLGDEDKDNIIATKYAFDRTHDILIREESLLFFNNLMHSYFFNDEVEDVDGFPMVTLGDFIKDEEKLGRIFSICGIAYAWNIEYRKMKLKGIDSEEKNIRRVKTLEKDYLMYENKDRLLEYYKIGNPRDNKSYKEVVFRPALSELLADNPHKKEIIKTLKNKIYTPQTPTK